MARLSNYLILVAFFVATAIATISATENESLSQCGKYMGAHCGKQVADKLRGSDINTAISIDCCYKLLQTGYPCHTKYTLYVLLNRPELKHSNWTELFAKSDQIYRQCDVLTSPGSLEFLAKCTENLGNECGEQVYNKLIHDEKISKPCCQELVKNGLQCHTAMLKSLIRIPEMRNANATQLLKKNSKIFNHCLHV